MLSSKSMGDVRLAGRFRPPGTVRHVVAHLAAFILLATGSAWAGSNDNANGAWLRNQIDHARNGAFIMLASGSYVIDEPLAVDKDITLFCLNIRGATIRSYQGLSDGVNGLVIQNLDAVAMQNGKADVMIWGIAFEGFHRAVYVDPTGSDDGKVLQLSLLYCGMDYCYYGLMAENRAYAPDFKLQDVLVDTCSVRYIQWREDAECGGIVVRSWFDGADIKNNFFWEINRQAITLGNNFSGERVQKWNDAEVTGNYIYHVWLNDQAAGGCYGILTFGKQHTIRDNYVENVFSSVASNHPAIACTGIYSKAQGPLMISDNTLVDAGGSAGALVVKTGVEGLYDSLEADTTIQSNVIYRTITSDNVNGMNGSGLFPDGSSGHIYRHSRTRGILVQGNHAVLRNNVLHHPSAPQVGKGMVIKVEMGADVAITGNSIYGPNVWYGIRVNLDHFTGDDLPFVEKGYSVTNNVIDGLQNHDGYPSPYRCVGIDCVRMGNRANWLHVYGNTIMGLRNESWITGIGVWLHGTGHLAFNYIAVDAYAETDATVDEPVLVE